MSCSPMEQTRGCRPIDRPRRIEDVTVSTTDHWRPAGKPIRIKDEWDVKPSAEARIDRDDGFVAVTVRQELVEWWLEIAGPTSWTPQWDFASTCNIEGRKGLILVEAKAHLNELSTDGKRKPRSVNGWKNHERIGSAIAQANVGLQLAAGGSWALSRDKCYQLSNRFGWSWKLASLGVPVVLIYLGFLRAEEMAPYSAPFPDKGRLGNDAAGATLAVCATMLAGGCALT